MTIKLPSDNFLDTILKFFGKKRKIIIPEGTEQVRKTHGPHVTTMAKKEPFLKALFRSADN